MNSWIAERVPPRSHYASKACIHGTRSQLKYTRHDLFVVFRNFSPVRLPRSLHGRGSVALRSSLRSINLPIISVSAT